MKLIIFFTAILLLSSCKKGNVTEAPSVSYNYTLSPTQKIKSFALDSETRYNGFYLYPFTDRQGKEYLSFLNYRTNQILFYDLNTCDFLFKVDLDKEGPNGLSIVSGYYIKDFDNMYVSTYIYSGLIKVDTTKRIIQKIPYGTTKEEYKIVPSYTPSSHPYVPPIFIGSKLYITQMAADHIYPASKTPVTVSIDTLTHECETMPFTYGDIFTTEQLSTRETACSRIFNNNQFIYSFQIDENIYVASIDHETIRKINIKSKYINNIPNDKIPVDFNQGAKQNLEVARYGDLIYDPYRKVYYRLAYPDTELENTIQWRGRAVYGRKKFSIIILDQNFNIIGETLFPENIYNSYVFFVDKEGLYMSRDYQMNYEQSENYMTFELFKLDKD